MKAGSILGAIFDLDGTIVDVPYDWSHIKEELQTGGRPILSYLEQLTEPEKSRKQRVLEDYELKATRQAVLKTGIKELLTLLDKKGVARALVTNNSQENTEFLLNKFSLRFNVVISRESGMWKPSASPLIAAMQALQVRPENSCVIGDSLFDIMAAEEAGIPRIFIINHDPKRFPQDRADIFPDVEKLFSSLSRIL